MRLRPLISSTKTSLLAERVLVARPLDRDGGLPYFGLMEHILENIPQGDHGGDALAVARHLGCAAGDILDFSSNSLIQARDLTEAIVGGVDPVFEHYPDSSSGALRAVLAAHEHCPPEELLAGNGSAELIWLALATARPRHAVLIGPAFSEYRRACEGLSISYTILSPPQGRVQWWPDARRRLPSKADFVFVCSPANPAGHVSEDLPALIQTLGCDTVLLDMAYRDFLSNDALRQQHSWAALKEARLGARLICLHSMTKFFCCTGVRLGYLAADPRLLREMNRRRPSWMVSSFAEQTGMALIGRYADYRARLPRLEEDKAVLSAMLRQHAAFSEILEGPCFCLAKVNPACFSTAGALRAALISRRVLLRDCDGIPGMPSGWVRIQARNGADTFLLKQALDACLTAAGGAV